MLLPAYLPWLHTWKYYFEKSRKPRFKSDIIRHLKSKDHCLPSSCLFLHYQQCEYRPNRPAKRNNPLSHRNFHRELCVNEYRIAHLQSPSQGQHLFFSQTIFPAIPALFPVPIHRPAPCLPLQSFHHKSSRRKAIISPSDLSHHRTYRSVYGGSINLTCNSLFGVVVFHGYKTKLS